MSLPAHPFRRSAAAFIAAAAAFSPLASFAQAEKPFTESEVRLILKTIEKRLAATADKSAGKPGTRLTVVGAAGIG